MCIFFSLLIPAFVTYFVRKLALCAFLNTGQFPKFEQRMQADDVGLIPFYQFLSTTCGILENDRHFIGTVSAHFVRRWPSIYVDVPVTIYTARYPLQWYRF